MASRRNYLSQSELAEYADITVTDSDEADDQITQAEELIDTYVGYQPKFYPYELFGKASAGSTTSLTLDTDHVNNYQYTDYFKGCMVEIVGGTNAGERRRVTASTQAGVLTTEAFTSAIDTTSAYKIFQLGKFPRVQDVRVFTRNTPNEYYKSVPEAVKRATAAQVQYIIEMGTKFFATDAREKTSESIGDYAYSKSGQRSSLIAPKAKEYLKAIRNRTGQIVI